MHHTWVRTAALAVLLVGCGSAPAPQEATAPPPPPAEAAVDRAEPEPVAAARPAPPPASIHRPETASGPAPVKSRGLTTDLADIVRGPGQYRDQNVTVQARIGAVVGASAFVLSAHPKNPEGTGNELLVISRSPVPGGPMDMKWLEHEVLATGRVGTWSAEELERELGQDLDASLEFEVEHVNAVLIADQVAVGKR